MTTPHRRAIQHLEALLQEHSLEELRQRVSPSSAPPAPRVPGGSLTTPEAVARRWELLGHLPPESTSALLDANAAFAPEVFARNIEQVIGTIKIPVGLAGPVRVNGLFAQGDYLIPLATTEAALVASYSRGMHCLSQAGGCTALLLMEGVSRAPGFVFTALAEAGLFAAWVLQHLEAIREAAEGTTRHGKLTDLRVTIEGNHVYLIFDYTTGDAAGQNMVTIATDAACSWIMAHSPLRPVAHYIEANLSGDKKASAQSFLGVRGKKVSAECVVPAAVVSKLLHTTPEAMTNYWRMSAMGGVLSGTVGVQGHFANGLAALFLATGQDAACVAEAAVGMTRFEVTAEGALYATVTLPNLIVGTVGGGTGLPTQRACLEIMGLAGTGHARAYAEVCAAVCLAGELSIIGALSAGHFTRAHQRLARGRPAGTHDR